MAIKAKDNTPRLAAPVAELDRLAQMQCSTCTQSQHGASGFTHHTPHDSSSPPRAVPPYRCALPHPAVQPHKPSAAAAAGPSDGWPASLLKT